MASVVTGRFSRPAPIMAHHITKDFACGKPSLDDWLKSRALRSEGRSARTFVVCETDRVVAYYCLSTGSVETGALPKRLAGDMPMLTPIILLGRLAVDSRYHGLKIGTDMLTDALLRSLEISRQVGCRAVLVHAIDEDAAAFYQAFGFTRFPPDGLTFFMPIKSIAALL